MSDEEFFEDNRGSSPDSRREQSTIAFPYVDLDAAAEVARALYNRGGLGGCEIDELAAEMRQTLSGAFRMKTAAARLFDFIVKEGRGGFKLSETGQRLISPDTERAARAEAFLKVPLYSAIFEKYRGKTLPPMKALEREMLGLGVSSKQTDKARQAFERSAKQAGFFESGEDRLVRPRVDQFIRTTDDEPSTREGSQKVASLAEDDRKRGEIHAETLNLHPFIDGLLKTLPPPQSSWSVAERVKWLQTAASIFGLIYKGDGEIKVSTTSETRTATA